MTRQVRNYLLLFLPFAMLLTALMQSGCNKEKDKNALSREEFINDLKGEWYVWKYTMKREWVDTPHYWSQQSYEIILRNDSMIHWIEFYYDDGTGGSHNVLIDTIYQLGTYALEDLALCTLPKIENIQHWTITEDADKLKLETINLCGITEQYGINLSNYDFQSHWGDLELVRGDSIALILGDFRLEVWRDTVTMNFYPYTSIYDVPGYKGNFQLRRP